MPCPRWRSMLSPSTKTFASVSSAIPDGLESDFIEAMVRVESFEQTQAAVARHVAVFDEKIFPHTMLVWDAAVNAHLNVGVALC
jgi:hypothetical protein